MNPFEYPNITPTETAYNDVAEIAKEQFAYIVSTLDDIARTALTYRQENHYDEFADLPKYMVKPLKSTEREEAEFSVETERVGGVWFDLMLDYELYIDDGCNETIVSDVKLVGVDYFNENIEKRAELDLNHKSLDWLKQKLSEIEIAIEWVD